AFAGTCAYGHGLPLSTISVCSVTTNEVRVPRLRDCSPAGGADGETRAGGRFVPNGDAAGRGAKEADAAAVRLTSAINARSTRFIALSSRLQGERPPLLGSKPRAGDGMPGTSPILPISSAGGRHLRVAAGSCNLPESPCKLHDAVTVDHCEE